MTPHRNQIDLSNATVMLLGRCLSNVLDTLDLNALRDDHTAGLLLAQQLHRAGLSVTRPVRLLVLPVVDAPAQARRMWDDDDPNEITQELPAPSFLLEGGE